MRMNMGQCLTCNITFSKINLKENDKMEDYTVLRNRHLHVFIIQVLIVLLMLESQCQGYMLGKNPHYRAETLDPQGRYQMEWLADFEEKSVTFNVTVQTKGYVGFGLSRYGRVDEKTDIVIGGVTSSGKSYFTDRYSIGNQMPELDERQDWKLNDAWESATHTFLSFSRLWDTCDQDDYPITVKLCI